MGEPIAGHRGGVIRVGNGHVAAHVFSEECSEAEHHVVAAAVASHARWGDRVLVVAPPRGDRLRVTPCYAQQRGVRPHRQRQHNRQYSCPKHVMLAALKGKNHASETRVESAS